MTESMKDWALQYAGMGFAVFPIKPRDKTPLTSHGFKDATTNKDMISSWWDKYPDANIAVATGSRSSGLVVIDLDRREDKGIDGYEMLIDWQKEHGNLPDTWQSITGGGGYHLFYRDSAINRSRAKLYSGVDVRGEDGYVVVPPSIHSSGNCYTWEIGPGDGVGITQADNTVMDFLMGSVPEEKEQHRFKMTDTIPEGERHKALIALIGSEKARGIGNDAIRQTVRSENQEKCIPPLTDIELEKEIFPALTRDWKVESPYYKKDKAVLDNGKTRTLKETPGLAVICLSDIEEKEIEWIWKPWIPKAKITLIQGAPGCSKTTLVCRFIADLTQGKPILGLDDGNENPFRPRQPLNVLYQITEDDFADTIIKRLRVAGADMSRVFNIDERENPLTFDDPRIEQAIKEWNIDVAVFDPVMSYVGKDTQLNMGNSVRAIMNPIITLGQETGCTFIVVAHTSKQTSAEAINRLIGSIDFISSARSVLTVGRNPNCEEQKALAHTKANAGPLAQTILYTLDYDDGLVKFAGYSDLTDNEIIAPKEPKKRATPAADEAKDFLLDILKDGYATSKEVNEAAKAAGISIGTLQKAKDALKIRTKHYKGDPRLLYWWLLPGREVPERLRQYGETEKVERSE